MARFNPDEVNIGVTGPARPATGTGASAFAGAANMLRLYARKREQDRAEEERQAALEERQRQIVESRRRSQGMRTGGGGGGRTRRPTESEKFSIGFGPFRDRIVDIMSSDLDPGEKARQMRKVKTQAILALPQYETRISGVLEELGVGETPEIPEVTNTVQEAFAGFLRTEQGQAATIASLVTGPDGSIDLEASQARVQTEFFKRQSTEARIQASKKELELLESDRDLYLAKSDEIGRTIATEHSKIITSAVANMASILDNPEVASVSPDLKVFAEALRGNDTKTALEFLETKRISLEQTVRMDLLEAGLPPDQVNKHVAETLKPFDNITSFIEETPERLEDVMKVADLQARQAISEKLVPDFGVMARTKAFQESILRNYTLLQPDRVAQAVGKLLEDDRKPFSLGNAEDTVKSPEALVVKTEAQAQNEGNPDNTAVDVVTLLAPSLSETYKGDLESANSVTSIFSEVTETLEKTNMPLSPDRLKSVLSPGAVANITEIIRRADQPAAAMKTVFTKFISGQFWNNFYKNVKGQVPKDVVIYPKEDGSLGVRQIIDAGPHGLPIVREGYDPAIFGNKELSSSVENMDTLLSVTRDVDEELFGILKDRTMEAIRPDDDQVEYFRNSFSRMLYRFGKSETVKPETLGIFVEAVTDGFFHTVPVSSEGLRNRVGGSELDSYAVARLSSYLDSVFRQSGIKDPDPADVWIAVFAPKALGAPMNTEVRKNVTVADVKNMFASAYPGSVRVEQLQEQTGENTGVTVRKLDDRLYEALGEDVVKTIEEAGVDKDRVFAARSAEDAMRAIRNGQLKEGDYVLMEEGLVRLTKEAIDAAGS